MKRFNIYKRDKCGLVCEILVPVILVIFGLGLLQIAFLKNSPMFELTTDAYPSQQRVLFNNELVVPSAESYSPQDFATKLPDYDSYWTVKYEETASSYLEYYQAVDEQQHIGDTEPFRFGSYQIYEADKAANNYKINVFINATSAMSVPYFH